MEERHLSLSEAADALDISERTAYRWIKSGKLRAYKPGRDYWIPESAIKDVVVESEVRPKAESRSSLEPKLFNGPNDGRRTSILADALVAAADTWLEAVSNPDIDIHKRFGIRDAAIELFDRINARALEEWQTGDTKRRREIGQEIGQAMRKLNEIPEEAYRAMPDETLKEPVEERRRKMREWTRRIA